MTCTWSRCNFPRGNKQAVVSRYHYKPVPTTKKLQDYGKEGVTYRKTQAHLKPYIPQCKKSEDKHSLLQSRDMQTFKSDSKKFNTVDIQVQSYSRPKRTLNPS